MNKKHLRALGLGLCLGTSAVGLAFAQGTTAPAAQGAAPPAPAPTGVPLPNVALPIREFATSEEHYNYLLDAAHGGTQHTRETIPDWQGLWSPGGNTMFSLFLENGTMAAAMAPVNAVVKEGVLTPEYEEAYKARRAEMEQFGEQPYDRLTHCEYPGLARWFWEPYTREFVNTPDQSWFLNDFMNEGRRVYIGEDQEHLNPYGTHSSTGDSIGFWDGDRLIVNTKYVLPADWLRGAPMTSNALETVEVWQMKTHDNGLRRIEVMVTFYDKWALLKPVTTVYTYNPRPDLENAGLRIRNWECETTSNSYLDADGNTNYFLPGDAGYQDARGTTAFPQLPGQTRDPLNEGPDGFPVEASAAGLGEDGMPALEGGSN